MPHHKRRTTFAVLAGFSLAAIPATLVIADDISNDLDASIDAAVEVMPLTAGGASGTTELSVTPRNGDGKNGCNLTGSTTLVVAVSSSDTAVATVSPSSVTFTSCEATATLTVAPVSAGTATVSLSELSNTTDGSFNLAPAAFSVDVVAAAPTNMAPSVTITGVTAGTTYDKGTVPEAMCEVTDAEDGPSSFPATLSAVTGPYASDGIGSQTASCSYTDAGGLSAAASVTYSIVDPTAPEVSYALTPEDPDGANGWYVTDVSLTWTVVEHESPNSLQTTGCVDQNITADQVSTTYSCSATSAGGSTVVTSVGIQRDETAPNVSLVGGPADEGSYVFGSVPAAPTCSAIDATSGLDGACVVSGYATSVGTHVIAATATDIAGNESVVSTTYTVVAWDLTGFFKPVDMAGVYNSVKGGSTVPLKFEVFAGTTELTDTSAVKSFQQMKVVCASGAVEDAIEVTSTGGTSLRYDTTAGQFIQNWQTPKQPGVCYKVTMTTQDDSTLVAYFKLK